MSVISSQQLMVYYERYKATELTFTKEIIEVTGLITKQVGLKCMNEVWPCLVYSSSFESAKIIVNSKSGLIQKLQQANQQATLKCGFIDIETGSIVGVQVNVRSMGYTRYGGSEDMILVNLSFIQRPPEDYIIIMSRVLDANANSLTRRNEHISIAGENQRKLHLVSENVNILVEGIPRQCILRDLSFFSAKVVIMGVAKFLENREVVLTLEFDDASPSIAIKGRFSRAGTVEGRRELITLDIAFDEALVPMAYKILINSYMSQSRNATFIVADPAPGTGAPQ